MKFPKFQQYTSINEQAITADGVYTFTLGVNPLSVFMLNLRPLNDTGTLSNFQSYLGLCDAVNLVTILYNGYPIVQARGKDLAILNWLRRGVAPYQPQHDDTDNERRCAILPIYFGKMPFDPTECLPEAPRGILQVQLDLDIADTGYDGLRINAESIELPDAKPKTFERTVSINQTFAATGKQTLDIPPGNKFRGFQLFGTTAYEGASPAPTWGTLEMRMDNTQVGLFSSAWEVQQAMPAILKGRGFYPYDAHKHRTTTDGNAQTLVTTVGPSSNIGQELANHAWIDFDPTWDDQYILDSDGAKTLQFVPNVGTADAVRVLPVEVLPVSKISL